MNYEKLSKKSLGCMYVATGITVLIFIIAIIIAGKLIPDRFTIIHSILFGVSALLIIIFLISPPFRYNRYFYMINDECIIVREGFIWINKSIVPIERLHIVSISKGPVDRMFGLSKVIVTTAGGDVTIRFLEDKKADNIADILKNKINDIASKAKGKVQDTGEE